MNTRALFLFVVLIYNLPLFAGTVVNSEIFSAQLGRAWKYTIYLPDNYNTSGERYSVFYLLHGNGDNTSAWSPVYSTVDSLTAAKKISPVILVIPEGKKGWWVNQVEKFEDAVIKELIPIIDSVYFTQGREGRKVAGYSMGGFGALRYGLVYPELFSGSAVMSPALYNEEPPEGSSARTTGAFGKPFDSEIWKAQNYPEIMKQFIDKKLNGYFFLGTGDDDWNHEEGFHYNVEYQLVLLYEELHKKNSIPADIRIINGDHSWDVWLPLFREAIQRMIPCVNNQGK
jgi:enterochelin esterase-like enzyme